MCLMVPLLACVYCVGLYSLVCASLGFRVLCLFMMRACARILVITHASQLSLVPCVYLTVCFFVLFVEAPVLVLCLYACVHCLCEWCVPCLVYSYCITVGCCYIQVSHVYVVFVAQLALRTLILLSTCTIMRAHARMCVAISVLFCFPYCFCRLSLMSAEIGWHCGYFMYYVSTDLRLLS